MIPKGTKESLRVSQLLKEAAKKPLSKEELREQKISWCMGMRSDNSTVTREDIEEIIDRY